MYAAVGIWDGVVRLRKMMKERKVDIVAAWSYIESALPAMELKKRSSHGPDKV